MNANPVAPRRMSLCIATFAVAILAGCGAQATATPALGHGTIAGSKATPGASSTVASTASLPADPCEWLLKADAQQLLGTAVSTVSDGLGTPLGTMSDGPLECSYSPGSVEGTASASSGAGETGVSVSVLDSTSFANAQESAQPETVSYTINRMSASTIFPGASSDARTFYAVSVAPPDLGHATWTYLNVQLGGSVYFRVGMVDPFISETQREARDQAAALDVLSILNIHP